jgi:hypothetical protein
MAQSMTLFATARISALIALVLGVMTQFTPVYGQSRDSMVRESYTEALGRAAQSGEITYWVGRTDWKTKADLINMHRQYLRQDAAAAREVVISSYQRVFNRAPSDGELAYWLPQVRQGKTCAELEASHRQYLASQPASAAETKRDPWIEQAFQEVLGRAPSGSEWDPKNYGKGKWSSYGDLLNKVRARMTTIGVVYIFIKPEQAIYQGHIAWGFLMDDGRYCYGSTENPLKPMGDLGQGARAAWDAITIGKGQDNGYWHGFADTEQEMLDDIKRTGNSRERSDRYPYGFRCSGYARYKYSPVAQRNAGSALFAADYTRTNGFRGVGWNCLDQTYHILEAYGTDKNTVMPWKQTHPSPNYWYNEFGFYNPKDRRAVKGGNTTGYAL